VSRSQECWEIFVTALALLSSFFLLFFLFCFFCSFFSSCSRFLRSFCSCSNLACCGEMVSEACLLR
jgi:hypothetical protein